MIAGWHMISRRTIGKGHQLCTQPLRAAHLPLLGDDNRTVEAVVRGAAMRIGKAAVASAIVSAFYDADIRWAWQLSQMPWDAGEWQAFGVSAGLKAAITAELTHAMPAPIEVNDRLRRFLLLPEQDGSAPRRLYSVHCHWLTLLTIAPEDRQRVVLTLFELLALIAGLLLPIPMFLLRGVWYPPATEEGRAEKGWRVQPSVADVADACATFIFFALLTLTFISVACAMMTAASGWQAKLYFYDALMPVLGFCFMILLFFCYLPLPWLIFLQGFTLCGSPYPMLVAAVAASVVNGGTAGMVHHFHAHATTLEVYHFPRWLVNFIRFVIAPHLASKLSDAALEPLAQKRAEELRTLMGLKPLSNTGGSVDCAGAIVAGRVVMQTLGAVHDEVQVVDAAVKSVSAPLLRRVGSHSSCFTA